MFHTDNNLRISFLLCPLNIKRAYLPEIRQPYFYCALKNYFGRPLVYWLLLSMEKIVHNHGLHVMWLQVTVKITITNYVNRWTSRRQVLDKFYNSICKFDESFDSGNRNLRIYYHWKIQNVKILITVICYRGRAAGKALRQTNHLYLTTSAQRGRNNAATLNLSKSDSLRVGVFFGSVFAVDLAGVKKVIFRNCIRNKFFCIW